MFCFVLFFVFVVGCGLFDCMSACLSCLLVCFFCLTTSADSFEVCLCVLFAGGHFGRLIVWTEGAGGLFVCL